MKAMVSVIIPVYNREQYIEECIRSVQAQSYTQFEIVLVDDGSTDDTLRICQALAEKEPRIRLLAGAHQGVSAARNLALEHARGEYMFFLDSDDIIYPELLAVLVEAMERTGASMGGTECAAVDAERWEQIKPKFLAPGRSNVAVLRKNEEAIQETFASISPISMLGGVIIRRELVGQTRFCTDLFIGEDFYFLYENLIKGTDVIFLEKKWYMNRYHSTNISGNYTYDGFQTRFLRRKLIWESEERLGRPENARKQKHDCVFIYLRCMRRCGVSAEDSKKMRKLLREHSKQILSGLNGKTKLIFLSAVYLPLTGVWLNRLMK